MTEIVLIQVFFFSSVASKQKNKNKNMEYRVTFISFKSVSSKPRSPFFLVQAMEFSIIFSCVYKVIVFLIILACLSKPMFNICMKMLNVFLTKLDDRACSEQGAA